MARSKPNPLIVENLEQAEGALAELAQIQRKLTEIELEQQDAIDHAKALASQKSQGHFARVKELENGLAMFGKLNKRTLFDKARSKDLGFGIIGFRASKAIEQQRGIPKETSLEKLKEFGFLEGIKVKESLNKDAMQTWSQEKLETVGLVRKEKDTFYIELKQDGVADVV